MIVKSIKTIRQLKECLAAMNTRCPYPNHTYACDGKPKIKCYLVHAINQWNEFIGCDKWKQNERGRILNQEDYTNYITHLSQGSPRRLELQRISCSFESKMLTPINLQKYPFGIHTHPRHHYINLLPRKLLKLKTAVLRGWNHDECIYKRIQIYQQTGVPISSKVKSDYGSKVKQIEK
ncbi:hypothetical protein GLOIN_2v1882422 [Rhizophagus clarus]|uniref:Uncharacterized protein n=1 Tax=Rhizophagus clarus TaxID=94130 RepID=A0A8H3LZ30_9GLOM|nr:hypothetical protein GLOIN_2v1882422 [Rhizophagus clarus]